MRKLLLATVAALGASMGVAAVADAQTPAPKPGTITVRLNGRFRFYAAIANDRDLQNPSAAPGVGTNKASNYTFGTYARLFPGFDGVAANGLKYGASLEIRQENNAGAGGGVVNSISGQSNSRGALYYRRLWGYMGTDQLGTIRVGAVDAPSSLYLTGNFENFDSGGFNGDHMFMLAPAAQLLFPFADVGNYNTGTKAMYLSPQFFGFDFGVSYEPNTGNGGFLSQCLGQGISQGCDRLSATGILGETARRRNTFDGVLRYRGTFAGVGVAATGAYTSSGTVTNNSGLPFGLSAVAANSRPQYDGLSVADFGVALTYGGFSVGGKYHFGRYNNQWGLAAKGVPDAEAFLVGSSYTAGPVVVGFHYLDSSTGGNDYLASIGQGRREQGLAIGSTYSLAPGLSIFASGLYIQRKQNGFNFLTNEAASAANPRGTGVRNKITSSLFTVGTSFQW